MLIAVMQVFPFIPTHEVCEEVCCDKPVTCCESMDNDGCEMAMTSCNMSLFIPLVTAPLIKVESNIQLDISLSSPSPDEVSEDENEFELLDITTLADLPPPGYFPLLI